MKRGTIIGLSIVAIIVLIGLTLFGRIMSTRGTLIRMEEQIDAQYLANQTSYDAMWKTFKEMAQVTDQQAEDFKEIYTGLIDGRYSDSQPLFQMIKEDNPQLNSEVYTNLQTAIESGRKQFNNNQTKLVDLIREYNTIVRDRFFSAGMILGKTKMDADKFVITSDTTKATFNNGGSEEINVFE